MNRAVQAWSPKATIASYVVLVGDASISSRLVTERVMLMGHEPPVAILAQSNREAQPLFAVVAKVLVGTAAKQGPRERDVLARGDIQLYDLERRSGALPFEECRPRLSISV